MLSTLLFEIMSMLKIGVTKDYIAGIQLGQSLTDPLHSMVDERQKGTEDISFSFYRVSEDRLS